MLAETVVFPMDVRCYSLNVYKNFRVGWQVCCSSPCHKTIRGYYMRLFCVENKSLII